MRESANQKGRVDRSRGAARLPGLQVHTVRRSSAEPSHRPSPACDETYDRPVAVGGDDWITVPAAARLLGLQLHTVYRLIENGELGSVDTYGVRMSGRPRRADRSASPAGTSTNTLSGPASSRASYDTSFLLRLPRYLPTRGL